MSGRYRVRWSLLLPLIGVFVVVPLAASLIFDLSLWALAGAWFVVFLIGAGGAGLRARGSVTQTLHYDPDQGPSREVDQQFKRPSNEGDLL
jgi:hypothetical protein